MLKTYIKRVKKGDEMLETHKDGYTKTKAKCNGILVKNDIPGALPVFVSDSVFRLVSRSKDFSDWVEVNG